MAVDSLDSDVRLDKAIVGQRFGSSASSYDLYATAQRHIYSVLEAMIATQRGRSWGRVLEIGCGTGGFTRFLDERHDILHWTINDLDERMIRTRGFSPRLAPEPCFLFGDAESIDLGTEYDLIVSASAIQWLDDPRGFVRRLHGLLRPGGILLLSTFGPDNLTEVRTLTGRGLRYGSLETVLHWLDDLAGQVQVSQEHYTLYFASPRDVLLHLKRTGVTGTASGENFWTAEKLRQFEANYRRQFSTEAGVRLTYHPLYIMVQT